MNTMEEYRLLQSLKQMNSELERLKQTLEGVQARLLAEQATAVPVEQPNALVRVWRFLWS